MAVAVVDRCQGWQLLFPFLESSPLRQVTVLPRRGTQHDDIPSQVTFAMLEAGLHQRVEDPTTTEFDPTHPMFLSHLEPFRFLKMLECNPRCRESEQCIHALTDSSIEQLASALPQLVMFCLGQTCEYTLHQTAIKLMISLSTHCISLETRYLPCDLSNTREDVKTESGEPADPRLEILSLCPLRTLLFRCALMPPVEDVEASRMVVSALRHLFPRLEPIEGWSIWKAALDIIGDLWRGIRHGSFEQLWPPLGAHPRIVYYRSLSLSSSHSVLPLRAITMTSIPPGFDPRSAQRLTQA